MAKDPTLKYKGIKELILKGEIKTFEDIFQLVSPGQFCKDTGIPVQRLAAIRGLTSSMNVGELITISSIIGIEPTILADKLLKKVMVSPFN